MEWTLEQCKRLEADPAFQARISSDEILQTLWKSRKEDETDLTAEYFLSIGSKCILPGEPIPRKRLARFFGRKPHERQLVFDPPTAGIISLLAFVKSPFIYGTKIRPIDVDIALRIMTLKRDAFEGLALDHLQEDLELSSALICLRFGIRYETARAAIQKIIQTSFAAYEMMPQSAGGGIEEECRFDSDWLAGIVAEVSQVSNATPEEIIWQTPMSFIAYQVMQGRRQKGVKDIRHRKPLERIGERMEYLMAERLKEYEAEDAKQCPI